jgi:hypothetical protein
MVADLPEITQRYFGLNIDIEPMPITLGGASAHEVTGQPFRFEPFNSN